MVVSADTSFLRSLYGADAHSSIAWTAVAGLSAPITIAEVGVFEFENSLRLTCWRKLISPEDVVARLAAFTSDCQVGRVRVRPCSAEKLIPRARALSREHTATSRNRTFDILLVAAALEIGADVFLTFDDRQRALAKAEGLRTEMPPAA